MQPITFHSRRSPVYGTKGMVASSQNYASQAGLDILRKGGNAVEAAITVAAVLAVTEPCSTGLGGDCFMLFYDAQTRQVHAMNGSGRAPAGLTLEAIRTVHGDVETIPPNHAHAITVPGTAAGWYDSFERFKSGNLTFEELLEPAASIAEDGFSVGPITALQWAHCAGQLGHSSNAHVLLADGGAAPVPGRLFRNRSVAAVLRSLGREGKNVFYRGSIGEAIVEEVQRQGGVLALEDMSAHETSWPAPISSVYKGIRLYECPPNGQGITALIALNILTALNVDWKSLKWGSVDHLHVLIEVMRIAFSDTRRYVADPDAVHVPADALLSPEYAQKRAALFSPEQRNMCIEHGYPENNSSTVSFQVVDPAGNAVSFVNSNYQHFGTGHIPNGCGFTLQNRGHNFSLDPSHPNVVAPGKRPYHTILPAIATNDATGELFATFTNMGGFMQPQGHVQLMINMIEFGMDPQAAIDAPRFCIAVADGKVEECVFVEDSFEPAVIEQLRAKGHPIEVRSGMQREIFGRAQIIRRDHEVYCGGSDGRADGSAMAF